MIEHEYKFRVTYPDTDRERCTTPIMLNIMKLPDGSFCEVSDCHMPNLRHQV